jgi:hypothetical protein
MTSAAESISTMPVIPDGLEGKDLGELIWQSEEMNLSDA